MRLVPSRLPAQEGQKGKTSTMNRRAIVGIPVVFATICITGAQFPASADKTSAPAVPQLPDTTTTVLPIEYPIDLTDAVVLGETLREDVKGYRFDNGDVVGEYYLDPGQTVDDFVADFVEDYGVRPAATGVIVERSTEETNSRTRGRGLTTVDTDAPEVVPESAAHGAMFERRARLAAMASATDSVPPRIGRGGSDPLWAPYSGEINAYTDNIRKKAKVVQGAWWVAPLGNSTTALPKGWGMEIEVNISNGDGGGSRPICAGGYKEANWAVNDNWSWSLMTAFGADAGAVGAYADYNDLSDPCGKNSIAIGMRYPQKLTKIAEGNQTVLVQITAPLGSRSSATVSGNYQAVSDAGCVLFPNMASTDCMGTIFDPALPGPSITNMTTLNSDRGWKVPDQCWSFTSWGQSPPSKLAWCPSI
ncbi:hypothetical protein ACFRFH_02625 [Leifsonia sp. NPDC056824]|uniref:hypothetical protein n=1 Tax=Leifsonia sp. NPDC056824 TaxID=3345953 RepID=UPI0036826847